VTLQAARGIDESSQSTYRYRSTHDLTIMEWRDIGPMADQRREDLAGSRVAPLVAGGAEHRHARVSSRGATFALAPRLHIALFR